MRRDWILACGLCLLLSAAGQAATTKMNVQVQSSPVRATASFLGKILATVSYGTSMEVLKTQGDWIQVKTAQGQVGWMHKSALTADKVALKSGSSTAKTGATSDELALAGKGFNSDVEREFKAKNKNLNFAAVDRMEKIKVTPPQMQAFLQAGSVKPAGGAQ